ncbi:MAG: SpoIIE family protein phosphatase [Bdellovibrionota bacterium]
MQVRWYHSLTFKLFLFISIFLLMVAAAVSGKNIFDFQKLLKDQLSEKLVGIAQSALSSVENQVQARYSQIKQTLQLVAKGDVKLAKENVKTLVESDSQILSFHIVRKNEKGKIFTLAYAFTGLNKAADMLGKDPAQIKEKVFASDLQWVKKKSSNIMDAFYLDNPTPVVGIPVLKILVPAITGNKGVNWGVLTITQNDLVSNLPNDKNTSSMLLDTKANVLLSPQISDVAKAKNFLHIPLVKRAVSGKQVIGSQEYKVSSRDTMIGTFAYSKILNSALILQRDPRLAYNEIKRQISYTALLSFIFVLIALLASYHGSRSITRSLGALVEGTQKIAQGDFHSRIIPSTKDEVAFVSHAVNFMSERIEHLMVTQVEAARQEKELETARTVQETLLPKKDSVNGPISVTGAYLPASECGGDWWSNFTTSEGLEFVCVADATGHGAAAALVTAMAFSSCMTMVKDSDHLIYKLGPAEILRRLNEIMCYAGAGKITMTIFVAFIDPASGEMIYSNAGHNFPLVIPKDVNDARLAKVKKKRNSVRSLPLKLGGSPLGFHETSDYQTKKAQLRAGDKVLLYTDGLIECTNKEKKMWGKSSLLNAVSEFGDQNYMDLKNKMIDSAFTYFDGNPIDDDVTVVVVEMDQNWVPRKNTGDVA